MSDHTSNTNSVPPVAEAAETTEQEIKIPVSVKAALLGGVVKDGLSKAGTTVLIYSHDLPKRKVRGFLAARREAEAKRMRRFEEQRKAEEAEAAKAEHEALIEAARVAQEQANALRKQAEEARNAARKARNS